MCTIYIHTYMCTIYIYMQIHRVIALWFQGSKNTSNLTMNKNSFVENERRKLENCPVVIFLYGIQVPSQKYMLGNTQEVQPPFFVRLVYESFTVFWARVYHHPKGTTMLEMIWNDSKDFLGIILVPKGASQEVSSLKTNISPQKWWLEDIMSYWNSPFGGWHVSFPGSIFLDSYCWWKKSCTTWDVWNLVNNEIFTILTG